MRVIDYDEGILRNKTLTITLVKHHRGTMPIILTCPHGGTQAPFNVPERTPPDPPLSICSGYNEFKSGGDPDTAPITEAVAQKILDLTGLSPYVVIARFERRFIDANRRRECAFTDPRAAFFYDTYHRQIADYVSELLSQNDNKGFLFDIHGLSTVPSEPADIYLGTANGGSMPRFNRANFFMRHGLRGLLDNDSSPRQTGPGAYFRYDVSPAAQGVAEVKNGGHTIRNYAPLINCIQIELARTVRRDAEKRNFLIEDLAFALINFVRRYAPF